MDVYGSMNVTIRNSMQNRENRITRSMRDFNAFIDRCALKDSPLTNARYTWINGQDSPTLCKLDRFLVTNCWKELYP